MTEQRFGHVIAVGTAVKRPYHRNNGATCRQDGCDRLAHSRGLCGPHYIRLRRGSPLDAPLTQRGQSVSERFWAKVEKSEDCWHWRGGVSGGTGYGTFTVDGKRSAPVVRSAHRVGYELMQGPIPDGLHLDHLCRNRLCVNPAHLEAVTQRENNRRQHAARQAA